MARAMVSSCFCPEEMAMLSSEHGIKAVGQGFDEVIDAAGPAGLAPAAASVTPVLL